MALKTVANLKDSVAGILSGIDLNNVDNLDGALERAARVLVQQADIPEATGTQNLTLYSGVYDYPCNSNIFGTSINDIRPQGVSREPQDFVYKKYASDFDRMKQYLPNGTMIAFQYSNGSPILRIKSTLTTQQVNISTMSDDSDWTAGGSISNLTDDTAVYYNQPASLRFTMTGSSAGTITSTPSTINLGSYEDVGVAFLAIQIPSGATATNLTSIQLKIGSSASAYDSVTQTTGFLGAWTAGEWLLVSFDFSTATSTGTPDWDNIDYVQITLNHTATLTNFRLGGLWMSLPSQNQVLYQTAAIFLPTGTTTPLSTITANTDTIMLSDPAYTLYEYESAISLLQQTGGTNADPTMVELQSVLHGDNRRTGLYNHYRGDNPSAELRQIGSYYSGSDYGYGYGNF